jgi:hypothetical protein
MGTLGSDQQGDTVGKLKISAFLCVISLGCQSGEFLSYNAQKIDVLLEVFLSQNLAKDP